MLLRWAKAGQAGPAQQPLPMTEQSNAMLLHRRKFAGASTRPEMAAVGRNELNLFRAEATCRSGAWFEKQTSVCPMGQ